MQFNLTEEQQAVKDLAAEILSDRCTQERLDQLEQSGEWPDRDLWSALADAGLLGVALPTDVGGGGLDLVALHLLLAEAGRQAAPIPLWPSILLGALPLATFGDDDQRALAQRVISGEVFVTAALVEDGRGDPSRPLTRATRNGEAWLLEGMKDQVAILEIADQVLVTAQIDGEAGSTAVFVVDPTVQGVTVQPQETVGGWPAGRLTLEGAAAQPLGAVQDGDTTTSWLLQHATVGLASLQAGVCDRAVRLSADYTSEREQFGKKIATFQAVGQCVADAFIDAQGIELTALHAAWLLGSGLPAGDEVAIAKFWAADGGHRVIHGAHHVHGGVGIDNDYVLHRYFKFAKQIEFTLGSATQQLRVLGRALAAEPTPAPA